MNGDEIRTLLAGIRRPKTTTRTSLEALRRVHAHPAAGANQRDTTTPPPATVRRQPGSTVMPPESPATRSRP